MLEPLGECRDSQREEKRGQCKTEYDLVFHTSGQLLRQRKSKVEFRRLLAAAGIRSIRLYDLRHTAATLAVAAGVSVKVISDQDEAAAKVERMLMG